MKWVAIEPTAPAPFSLCPVCQSSGECQALEDLSLVVCRKTKPPMLWSGKAETVWKPQAELPYQFPHPRKHRHDWKRLAIEAYRKVDPDFLIDVARSIGVSAASLMLIGAGWDGHGLVFPIKHAGEMVGAVRVEHRINAFDILGEPGLIIPGHRDGSGVQDIEGPIVVCNGPGDTAALLDLGFDAIGHAAWNVPASSWEQVLVRRRDVVVLAEDTEADYARAHDVAAAIFGLARSVKVIAPQGRKDAREWIADGASRAIIESTIRNAWTWQPDEEAAAA